MVVNIKDNISNSKDKKNLIPVTNNQKCFDCKKDCIKEKKQ